MDSDRSEFVVVLRTGKLYEVDTALLALKEANVPCFAQQQGIDGVRFAMPAMPTAGPGLWYIVLVPVTVVQQAQDILSQLPIEVKTDPDAWDFTTDTSLRINWKTAIILFLIAMVLTLLLPLMDNILTFFR